MPKKDKLDEIKETLDLILAEVKKINKPRESESFFPDNDELYEMAKELAIKSNKISVSLLQRRLRVGYARAARLLDILEENGIVGPADGAEPREVLSKALVDK